jgi:hypothetical protein
MGIRDKINAHKAEQEQQAQAKRQAPPRSAPDPFSTSHNGDGPFSKLADLAWWADILEPAGWEKVQAGDASTLEAWQHPAATHPISAKVLKINPHVLVVWSTGCGLPDGDGQKLTKGRVYAHLWHGGNESAAATAMLKGEAAYLPPHIQDALKSARQNGSGSKSATGQPPPADGSRLIQVAELLNQLRTWQHLPDPAHVIAALATAATRNIEGEPCWLLMVAPPSSGKTETARLLDDIADARLNEVTAAGLLGWSRGKIVKPSGILTRIGEQALVTFGDLSSLLANSDRGGRDQVFGLLRRAYDGHVTRDIAPPGKTDSDERLSWSGRLTVVACVTGAIDRYAAHADQLGPRWMQVRIAERATHEKRRAAKLARCGDLAAHRKSAREAVAELLAQLPENLPKLPDDIADEIEDAALVTAWGRGAVPRNGYGRREIEGMPIVEEPMRLVQQLDALARGVLALGLPGEAVSAITRRVALDSMPEARRAVLQVLSTGEVLNTSACARQANLHRHVARMALEDLAAIGVVANDRRDEDDDHEGTVNWSLVGEDGDIITGVFEAFRQSGGGWHETWVYTSTSPP